ncbi:MAG TPA: hypothetical protein VFA20_29400 [Myxococcaceae bacterium]|nr:hypothetical protein [Myxococcaceae bacterium]
MTSKAAEQFLEEQKKQREAIRAKVAKAKASSGKEAFDFQAFAKAYDVSQDYGSRPVTPEVMERYEEEYYLGPVQAKTVKEFAERKTELKLHDAG